MQMGYRNNDHALAFDGVDDTIRKPFQSADPGVGAQGGAMHREIFESGQTRELPLPKIARPPRLPVIHTSRMPHRVHFALEAAN